MEIKVWDSVGPINANILGKDWKPIYWAKVGMPILGLDWDVHWASTGHILAANALGKHWIEHENGSFEQCWTN